MVVFSKIKSGLEFLFKLSPELEKHRKVLHPLLTYLIAVGGSVYFSQVVEKILRKKYPFLHHKLPKWGKTKALPFLIAYYLLMLISRVAKEGPWSFYEMIWVCNVTMVLVR